MNLYYKINYQSITEVDEKPFKKQSALHTLAAIQIALCALENMSFSENQVNIKALKEKAAIIKQRYIEKAKKVHFFIFYLFGIQKKIQQIEAWEKEINPPDRFAPPLKQDPFHKITQPFLSTFSPKELACFATLCKSSNLAVKEEIKQFSKRLNIQENKFMPFYYSFELFQKNIALRKKNFTIIDESTSTKLLTDNLLLLKNTSITTRSNCLFKMAELNLGGELIPFICQNDLSPSHKEDHQTAVNIAIKNKADRFMQSIVKLPLSQEDLKQAEAFARSKKDQISLIFIQANRSLSKNPLKTQAKLEKNEENSHLEIHSRFNLIDLKYRGNTIYLKTSEFPQITQTSVNILNKKRVANFSSEPKFRSRILKLYKIKETIEKQKDILQSLKKNIPLFMILTVVSLLAFAVFLQFHIVTPLALVGLARGLLFFFSTMITILAICPFFIINLLDISSVKKSIVNQQIQLNIEKTQLQIDFDKVIRIFTTYPLIENWIKSDIEFTQNSFINLEQREIPTNLEESILQLNSLLKQIVHWKTLICKLNQSD